MAKRLFEEQLQPIHSPRARHLAVLMEGHLQRESEPGRRRARISRSDGRKIRVAVPPGDEHEVIKTSPEKLSAQAAIDVAKQAIDGGRMR
jgi:hypothetical protein